jgi:acetyl esterase/lipase
MRHNLALFVLWLAATLQAAARPIPPAIYTDPPADAAHPASMHVFHIPSDGAVINGIVYSPPGAGPHPTLVICHGLPGDEKNLDLAQAVRRTGWNAVTFYYRGAWGSQGAFSRAHSLDDAEAVLDYLRDPKNSAALEVDPKRIAIAGHSFGGWVAAFTAAQDRALIGTALISPVDVERRGDLPRDKLITMYSELTFGLAGTSPEMLADEIRKMHAAGEFRLVRVAPQFIDRPLLVLTSDDGFADHVTGLVQAIRDRGGKLLLVKHVATDHSWSDHRIALETLILDWLSSLP